MGRKRNNIYDEAYKLYKSGMSLSEVADVMGVTRQSVYKSFKKRFFVLRKTKKRIYQIYNGQKFSLRDSGYFSLTVGKRTLMHRYVWENEVGTIPDGWDIHHINENKSDNRIENLECLPKSEHTRLYSPHNNQFTRGRKRYDTHRVI